MQVIHSLEMASQNCSIAWQLLKDRYENKKLMILSHYNLLFEFTNFTYKENHPTLKKFLDEG